MAHQSYLYLKLLLRNNLLLDLDEYTLSDTVQQGLVCNFMGMCLSSAFQPLITADGKVAGREALLRASLHEHGDLTPEDAFDRAIEARRLVQFDRLVRTIHLLNHARSFAEHELLFLNVHPRLLASVSDHGRTFEQILHYYSVPTSRVVIEIRQPASGGDAGVVDAVNNYRSLGYRIAVDGFGAIHSSLEQVLKLRPDIVKLDGALIRAAEHSNRSAGFIDQLVERFHSAGMQAVIEGIETARQLEIARKTGADLLQGYQLGQPAFAANMPGRLCRDEQLAA